MQFDPNNNIIQLCLNGLSQKETGNSADADKIFLQAWNEATNDFEKFTAAYFMARNQNEIADKLNWYETSLLFAMKQSDLSAQTALPFLYDQIAKCYEQLGEIDSARRNAALAKAAKNTSQDKGPFYHGTKADLKPGDLLTPGAVSNYDPNLTMNHIYFTALPNGAGLAAGLAKGEGRQRVYIVEPTGDFENDPNVTDKRFAGNPTRSYRSKSPLKIIGELTDWSKQTKAQLEEWHKKLAQNKGQIIN